MQQHGANIEQMIEGVFPQTPDTQQDSEKISLRWEKPTEMPTFPGLLFLWGVHHEKGTYEETPWAIDDLTHVYPLHVRNDGTVRLLELFSGGYGGWSYAARFLKQEFHVPFQTISVEKSWHAVVNFATIHGARIIEGTSGHVNAQLFEDGHDYVIRADITDLSWQEAVANWRPSMMVISSPCQKWSKGGHASGLDDESGLLLPEAILLMRKFRPLVAMLEQVPGFPAHDDAKHVFSQIRASGYQIVWSKILDSARYGCAHRPRWLCLAILQHEPCVGTENFEPWNTSRAMSPNDMDTVVSWPKAFIDALKVPEEALQIASQAQFLPKEQRAPYLQDGKHILKTRCYSEHETHPVIMARYGYQHEIHEDFLRNKGYFAVFFVHGNDEPRFFHPLELAIMHTSWDVVFVNNFLGEAWEHIGNLISMPHGLLLIANGLNQLNNRPEKIDVQQALKSMWDQRIRSSASVIRTWPEAAAIGEPDDDRFDGNFYFNYQQIRQIIQTGTFPKEFFWHREQGFQSLELPQPRLDLASEDIVASLTTQIDEDMSPTQDFAIMQKAQITGTDATYSFWFARNIPLADLGHLWGHWYEPTITPQSEQASLHAAVQLVASEPKEQRSEHNPVVAIVMDSHLSLYGAKRGQTMRQALNEWGFQEEFCDQYGNVDLELPVEFFTMLIPKSKWPSDYVPSIIPAIALAAFMELESQNNFWNPNDQSFCIHGKGTPTAVATMAQLWTELIPDQILKELCLTYSTTVGPSEYQVIFRSYTSTCPVPPSCFWKLLTQFAIRFFFDQMASADGEEIRITMMSRIYWQGKLDSMTTIDQIINILTIAMTMSRGEAIPRLVAIGKQRFGATQLQEIPCVGTRPYKRLHIVMSLKGGGRELTRTQTRDSIAATLLERGHDISWVTQTLEDVLKRAGYSKVQAIAQLPGGKHRTQEVIKLCQDCQIEIPAIEQKRAEKMVSLQQTQKQRRLQPVQPDPNDYRVETGFLLNQDGSVCEQVQGISNHVSGVVLLTPAQAEPWLREQQKLSKDELAMFIIGKPTISTSLQHAELMLPCRNAENQQVVLSGTLVQLGDRHVKTIDDKKGNVDIKNCCIVACTAWKQDWQPEDWSQFLKNTMNKFRAVLGAESKDVLVSTWGRSLRKGPKLADETTAESVQIHGTFREEALSGLLARSGFNGIFMTPKGPNGRSSDMYRIVWLGGDKAHAASRAPITQSCLGMVRGKNSLGLRFTTGTYGAAWRTIFPDQEVPTNHGGIHAWKIENLPYGCDAKSLESWALQYSWHIRGIKALGARAWLVTSNQDIPSGILLFNGNPIIAKFLPPKSKDVTAIVVAGPKPIKGAGKGGQVNQANQPTQDDAWAAYRERQGLTMNRAVTNPPRSVEGPVETKFQQQDTRLQALETSVAQLMQTQTEMKKQTEDGFQAAAKRDEDTKQMVTSTLFQFKSEMEQSVTKAIEKQSITFNESIADLKRLMTQSISKRGRDKEDGDMETDS